MSKRPEGPLVKRSEQIAQFIGPAEEERRIVIDEVKIPSFLGKDRGPSKSHGQNGGSRGQ